MNEKEHNLKKINGALQTWSLASLASEVKLETKLG